MNSNTQKINLQTHAGKKNRERVYSLNVERKVQRAIVFLKISESLVIFVQFAINWMMRTK